MSVTYDVRVWKIGRVEGKTGIRHQVRWVVEGRPHKRTFRTASLADAFRSDLLAAARKGEAFETETGLPHRRLQTISDKLWYEFACEYVDMKWKRAAAKYRKSIAEALMSATLALLTNQRRRPDERTIRSALLGWGFNTKQRNDPVCPAEVVEVLQWVSRNTKPVSALAEPRVTRAVLDAVASKIDGTPAAATTVNRKRAVFSNALSFAVEVGLLASNPVESVKWRAPKATRAVDRRSVVNPLQARTLLAAVRTQRRSGPRLVAFFGVMYFAALRPEEALNLRTSDLQLPASGWGEIHLHRATPFTGRAWTDTGDLYDERQLKHRAEGESRTVPCPPELVALLQEHLRCFRTDDGGRLFIGERGDQVPTITYESVWRRARQAVFSPELYASPLARRPYDLRHAAVSTWLNSGVPAPEVAEWAGHSVAVLLEVYAKCLEGGRQGATARVDAALGWTRPGWEVGASSTGASSTGASSTQIGREKPKTAGDRWIRPDSGR
jgi:integrase